MPKPLPTDREILEAIYERYYDQFTNWSAPAPGHPAKMFISIDIPAIADDCGADYEIVFARLYYHLEPEHGFTKDDGRRVRLFDLNGHPNTPHCVHFALLSAVLAPLRAEDTSYRSERRCQRLP